MIAVNFPICLLLQRGEASARERGVRIVLNVPSN